MAGSWGRKDFLDQISKLLSKTNAGKAHKKPSQTIRSYVSSVRNEGYLTGLALPFD